ncbi:MAG: VapE domain-containing protein [Pseudomonadota bacterium]
MPVTASDFEDLGETDEPEDEKEDSKEDEEEVHDWLADLLVDNQGICKPAFHNVRLILSNDPRVAPCIALNEFTREVVRVKPFREGKKNKLGLIRQKVRNPKDGDLWSGVDYGNLQSLLSAGQNCGGYQFEIGRDKLRDALGFVAAKNSFHPVRDQLEKFEALWERSDKSTSAVETVLDYLGLEHSPYHVEAWYAFLVATVTRVYEPGHKFDCVPILAGAQGARKSTFIRFLALGRFKELSSDFDNLGRMIESMKGGWICEAGERDTQGFP